MIIRRFADELPCRYVATVCKSGTPVPTLLAVCLLAAIHYMLCLLMTATVGLF